VFYADTVKINPPLVQNKLCRYDYAFVVMTEATPGTSEPHCRKHHEFYWHFWWLEHSIL